MSIKTTHALQTASQRFRYGHVPFRMRPMAAIIAGMALMISGSLHAADITAAESQTEIAQQKKDATNQDAAIQPAAKQDAEVKTDGDDKKNAAQAIAPQEEQQTLGEVTVRAAPAIASVQDVPASISVVSGDELSRLDAQDLSSITKRAANVSWNQGNQRSSSISIRGIGKIGTTEAQDPSVGFILDGVSYAYNALTSSYDFNDIDTVQVARGPQGTLMGKNANVGLMNITTNRPSFTPSADYSLTVGERNTIDGVLTIGGPIKDDVLAWRGVFSVDKADGDMVNLYNPGQTFTNTDRLSGRVQFLLVPSKDFNARFSFDIEPNKGETTNGRTINTPTPPTYSNGTNSLAKDPSTLLSRGWFTSLNPNYSYSGNYLYGAGQNAVDQNGIGTQITGQRGASAELNWTLGNNSTLTSISAYRQYFFDALNDEGTPFDINTNNGGFLINYKQISQELRLSSEIGGPIDYQAGVYLLQTHLNADYQKGWGSDAGAWYANGTQYSDLMSPVNPNPQLLKDSLNGLTMYYNSPSGTQEIQNSSDAFYGQLNWHASDQLTLSAGARITHEERENTGSSVILDNGTGAALNPVQVNGVQLGGFNSSSSGVLGTNTAAQTALANAVAQQYFGVPTYAALTATQQQQVADAKAIRAAQIGTLFNPTQAQPYVANLPTLNFSPSYKINDDLTTYVSFQFGAKAGISQFVNGVSDPVKTEKTMAYEWGIKSSLLNKTLLLNADIYFMNIANYQQAVKVYDSYSTALNGTPTYTSATGNVPAVQAQGLELDAFYSGIKNTTIRVAAAYNDAYYKYFPNSGQPLENGYTGAAPYRDVSGQTLPGASKLTFNVGVDYQLPVLDNKLFHTSFNTAYASKFNSDPSLSQYAWVRGSSITDFAIGLGNQKKTYDVSLLVKNLFDNSTVLTQTWDTYTPAIPRWIGIVLTGKL